MKHLFAFLCFLTCCSWLHAQDAKLVIGCKKNAAGKTIVQLKFMFPDLVVSPYSINVFRKKIPSGNWEKINSAPIEREAVIAVDKLKTSPRGADDAYKNYQGFMNHKPASNPKDEKNIKVFAGLMVVGNNAFATYAGCYTEDVNAETGATYQYRITDAKKADKELAVSQPFLVALNYLPAIADFSAKQSAGYVRLNWNKQQQFYAYKLYRKKSLTDQPVAVTKRPIMLAKVTGEKIADNIDAYKYQDTANAPGSKVYYQITGIDVLNNESDLSKELLVEVRDMIAPDEVSNVRAEKKNKDAVLSWKPVTGKDCIGYNIYRSSIQDTAFRKINTSLLQVGTTSYTDPKPVEGTDYAYSIESVDAAGNVSRTHMKKVFFPNVTPPEKPRGLKGVSTPGIVTLTWNKNAEGDMLGYFLYRASIKNDKSYYNLISKAPIKGNSFIDTLPGVAKNEFVYYLQAVDKYYNKSANSDTVAVRLPDTLAPRAPRLTDARYADKSAVLEWAKPADEDVTAYDIYKTEDSVSGIFNKVNDVAVREQTFTDKKVEGNKTYYYYVKARDEANNLSAESNMRAIYVAPDTAALTAAENVRADFSNTDSAVHVTWSSSSKYIQGYIIFRKEEEGNAFVPVSGMVTTASFIDKEVQSGTSYQYMVRSFFTTVDIYKNSVASKFATVN